MIFLRNSSTKRNLSLLHKGEPNSVASTHWTNSNHVSEIEHQIFIKNLTTLDLWDISLICCSTSTLLSNVRL